MVKLQTMDKLFENIENIVAKAENMGESYCMVVKPYFRRIIINPVVFKEEQNIYVANKDCTVILNVFNYDEVSFGVTDTDFYNKYDFKGNIIR